MRMNEIPRGGARRRYRPDVMALEARIALASDPSSGGGSSGGGFVGSGIGYQFSNWPVEPLRSIRLDPSNTQPIVGPSGQEIRASGWRLRDPFVITTLEGRPARIGGWYLAAALATPRNDAIGTLREFSVIISRDGTNWREAGPIVKAATQPGGLGDQLFSGDMRYDARNNRILIYYTPVQGSNASEYVNSPSGPQMRQEIAVASVRPVANRFGVTFTNFTQYGIKLRPDGAWYATPEAANTETEVYGFRDPYFFRDPRTGVNYLLFTANWGSDQKIGVGSTGSADYPDAGPQRTDPRLPRNDAVVGLAVATDNTLTNWRLLPPMFGSIGVNEQLELPHVFFQNGRYYLFLSTHDRTFIGDLKYDFPEGMYGFVSEELTGIYRPLNGSSLVIANPPEDPLQNYAWKAFSIGNGDLEVISFINKDNSSTIAPALRVTLKRDTARITGVQAHAAGVRTRPNGRLPLQFALTPTLPPLSATTTTRRAARPMEVASRSIVRGPIKVQPIRIRVSS